eukprot:1841010-Amphidinium_carterae.1
MSRLVAIGLSYEAFLSLESYCRDKNALLITTDMVWPVALQILSGMKDRGAYQLPDMQYQSMSPQHKVCDVSRNSTSTRHGQKQRGNFGGRPKLPGVSAWGFFCLFGCLCPPLSSTSSCDDNQPTREASQCFHNYVDTEPTSVHIVRIVHLVLPCARQVSGVGWCLLDIKSLFETLSDPNNQYARQQGGYRGLDKQWLLKILITLLYDFQQDPWPRPDAYSFSTTLRA